MNTNHYDVIIIGGGAAGLTAGIYLSRSKVKTLVLNQGAVGGQMVLTHEIANYPGVLNINGYQLARNMRDQAKSFGCKIKSNVKITKLDLAGELKTVEVNQKEIFSAKAVILASGGRARNIGANGEQEFAGKGISYCATCDGDFFQDKNIIVVGGGNSALEEAVSLTKYASKVTVVHQFDHFQAFKDAVKEAEANPKINFIMETVITEFSGAESLKQIKLKNLKNNETSEMDIDGAFILIGYVPNTEFLEGMVELNDRKEIITNEDKATSLPGVFAAGDAIAKKYRQVTTAVADGTIAALSTIDFLN